MIENIRKYTGLMIVVLVLLFVGLVFLDGGAVSRALGGKPVMEVGDQPISQKEFSRQTALIQLSSLIPGGFPLPRETRILASHYLGDAAIENENLTSGAIIMEMARFLQVAFPYGPTSEDRFITNRISIQKAGLEYGVTPSDGEVESFVKNVLFADPEGNYDQVAYSEFLKSRVGSIGGNRGFIEYVRDLLTAQNLAKLIGGGLSPELETVRLIYDTNKQVISGKQIALDSAPYEGEAKPSEEELKTYFEENQDNYQSDELRKVSYVLIEPDWEATLKTVTEEKELAKKAADEKAKLAEEAKKKAEEAAKKANEAIEGDKPATGTSTDNEETTSEEKPATGATGENPGTTDTPADEPESTGTPPAEETSSESPSDPSDRSENPGSTPAETPDSPANGSSEEGSPEEPDKTVAIPGKNDDPNLPSITPPPSDEDLGSALDRAIEDSKPENDVEIPKIPDLVDLPDEPKSPKDQLNGLEKRNAVEALASKVDEFYDELVNNRGEDFEKIAAEKGHEVKTTEFFSKSDPPELFSAFVQNSRVGKVSDDVFQSPVKGDPDELLSEPLQTPEGWIVFRFDEAQDAIPLSFEEARTKVSIDLKKKMAREILIEKANDLHEKLAAALADGKSFEEAAKELEQEPTDLKNLTEGQTMSFGGRSQKMPNPPAFDAAKFTNAGEIAPVEFTPSEEEANRALIIYVEKRQVVKDAKYLNDLETAFQQRSRYHTLVAFENWLNDRYNESDVVPPKTENQ